MSESEEHKAIDTASAYERLAESGLSPKNEKEEAEKEKVANKKKEETGKKAKVASESSSKRADIAAEVSANSGDKPASSAGKKAAAEPNTPPPSTSGISNNNNQPSGSEESTSGGWGEKIKGFFTNIFSSIKESFEKFKTKISGWFGNKEAEESTTKAAAVVTGGATIKSNKSGPTKTASHAVSSSPRGNQEFVQNEKNPEENEVSDQLPGELIDELKELAASKGAKFNIAPKMVYMGHPKFNYKKVVKEKKMGCLERSQGTFSASNYTNLPGNTQQVARKMSLIILRYLREGKIPFLYGVQVNINGINMRMPTTWHKHPNTSEHKAKLAKSGFSPKAIAGLIRKHPGVEVWPQKSAPSGTLV